MVVRCKLSPENGEEFGSNHNRRSRKENPHVLSMEADVNKASVDVSKTCLNGPLHSFAFLKLRMALKQESTNWSEVNFLLLDRPRTKRGFHLWAVEVSNKHK